MGIVHFSNRGTAKYAPSFYTTGWIKGTVPQRGNVKDAFDPEASQKRRPTLFV
jgi:hypothetical protein